MEVQIIKNKNQYEKTLQRFEEIFHAKSNTKEGNEAQLLALVIKDYEDKHRFALPYWRQVHVPFRSLQLMPLRNC